MQASATRSPIPSRLVTGVPWTRLWGIRYWKSKSAHFLWRATSYNYICIYICNSKVRSIRRFTYIYPIFIPSWQAAGHVREMMWTRNLNFRNALLFFLTIYLRSTPCLTSSLSIIMLIFTKIHRHQKTLKTKDVRLLIIYSLTPLI